MKKMLTLLSLFILSLACLTGYLTLNKLIIAGSLKIVAGEKQIAEGEAKLKKGKERLASGEHELSRGKQTYNQMNKATALGVVSTMGIAAPVLIASVAVNKAAGDKISEGDRLVAQGKEKVQAGEKKLAAGKEQLRQGIKRLDEAKWIRTLCASGGLIFGVLFLGLGFFWRPRATKKRK